MKWILISSLLFLFTSCNNENKPGQNLKKINTFTIHVDTTFVVKDSSDTADDEDINILTIQEMDLD